MQNDKGNRKSGLITNIIIWAIVAMFVIAIESGNYTIFIILLVVFCTIMGILSRVTGSRMAARLFETLIFGIITFLLIIPIGNIIIFDKMEI